MCYVDLGYGKHARIAWQTSSSLVSGDLGYGKSMLQLLGYFVLSMWRSRVWERYATITGLSLFCFFNVAIQDMGKVRYYYWAICFSTGRCEDMGKERYNYWAICSFNVAIQDMGKVRYNYWARPICSFNVGIQDTGKTR